MDQEREEQKQPETSQGDSTEETGEENSYSFIKETIKKRPPNKRSIVLRVIAVAAAAVGFGVIAAFVFAAMRPVAERVVSGPEEDPRVSIPADEEPAAEDTSSASSSSEAESAVSETGQSTAEETAASSASSAVPEETPAATPPAESEEEPQQEGPEPEIPELPASGITLEQYRQLNLDMLAAAEEAEKAVVQVVGVSNEMDYFLQGHENRKQAAGLVVAKTSTTVFILSDVSAVTDVGEILVTFSDGTSASGTVIRSDENTGLVAIRTDAAGLTPQLSAALMSVSLGNSFSVVRGEPVMAVGSPDGLGDAVAFGMVTSVSDRLYGTDAEYALLSTDIDGVSSSGAIVNLKGEVVGFVTQKLSEQGGSSVSALSISRIKSLIEHLLNNDALPYAGIRGQTVTSDLSGITGIPVGLLVTEVEQDSPAMLAGIKELDVITEIAGSPIVSMDSFSMAIANLIPGQPVEVKARRQGADGYAEISFTMTLEQR